MGCGHPRFPPDSACRAVLTPQPHPWSLTVAYGALTPSGPPFQRGSADDGPDARGPPSPPDWAFNPRAAPPAGSAATRVWALPLSLAATEGLLSLPPGTEMFQFPGCPPRPTPGCGAIRPAGCPIRRPPDPWPPAPPRGVSPRGRVLPRPAPPRHPPCALSRGPLHTPEAFSESGRPPTIVSFGAIAPTTRSRAPHTPDTQPHGCSAVRAVRGRPMPP